MKKTIKEIYNCEFIKNPETNLIKHYNQVINKTPDDLNVEDVCMLVRQEMFLDIAVPKAINLIKNDHSVGDYYDYCLLVNLAKMESSLVEYKEQLISLIELLEKDFSSIEFELDSDKEDYLSSIARLKEKIEYK